MHSIVRWHNTERSSSVTPSPRLKISDARRLLFSPPRSLSMRCGCVQPRLCRFPPSGFCVLPRCLCRLQLFVLLGAARIPSPLQLLLQMCARPAEDLGKDPVRCACARPAHAESSPTCGLERIRSVAQIVDCFKQHRPGEANS